MGVVRVGQGEGACRLRLGGGDPVPADPAHQEFPVLDPHDRPFLPADGLTSVNHQSGDRAVEPDVTHPLIVEQSRRPSRTITQRPEVGSLHGHARDGTRHR